MPVSTWARPSAKSAASTASDSATGTRLITSFPSSLRLPPLTLAYKELSGGVVGQPEQWLGFYSEYERGEHADRDRTGGERARPHHHRPACGRLAEEHQHDHPDVGEREEHAAQRADDDQRHRPA